MLRYFLFVLAVLIVLSLAVYAGKLWLQIYRRKRLLVQAKYRRYLTICDSIEIIGKAMQSEQCDLSEGVMRLKPLMDVLGKPLSAYPAMWALYQFVEEMPILEARKQLKRNERMKQDLARQAKEIELDDQIKQELQQLLKANFELTQQFAQAVK